MEAQNHIIDLSRVAGTMVARSSSVRAIARSKPSPTSAHACREATSCTPVAKRLASVAPEVNFGECTLHSQRLGLVRWNADDLKMMA